MQRILKVLPLLLLLACGGGSDPSTDFTSPKSLFVDYVSSFTGSVVSSRSDIRLKLAKTVSDSLIGTTVADVFSFSPALEGEAIWEDNRTIVFQPAQPMSNGQSYEVTADLSKVLKDIEKDKKEFRFMFQTLVQNYEASVFGLKLYNSNDLTRVKVEGQVQTADYVSFESVQKLLSASQGNTEKKVTWENTGKDNIYRFVVEDVSKSKSESSVRLAFKGEAIGTSKDENLTVEVPSLDNYKVVSSKVVDGAEKYISVLFSDPLDTRQNLRGLVILSGVGGRPRLVVNLNELKIYPTQNVNRQMALTIKESVKNTAGYELKEDYKATLQFVQVKPEVKLVDTSDKSIMPTTNGLTLPFEAVGLSAVEVTVIRVFEENVLQYLQVNNFNGQSQLRRVARPIARKTVPLNTSGVTNLNTWNRFSLNLDDILTTEPGAIYQIRIGFKKRHSLYFCGSDENIAESDDDLESWGVEEESTNWDNYESYYSSNYSWEDRDNPCSDSYYGNRRSVQKMIFASDMGIIAKRRDRGELMAFVSNLVNTEPISGAQVIAYDYQQQEIGSGTTDGEGKVTLAMNGEPFVLVTKNEDQRGYLKVDDGSALSLSNFDVSGNRVQNGIKGFIYGERGVWRPADTVHLGFILEDATASLPEDHPVIMELQNPNGQLTFRKVSSESVSGIFRFDFITDQDAPTGDWLARAKVGGATFTKTVKIETIKPNRLKVELKFDKESFSANDQYVSADLNVRWLSGATAANLDAEYQMKLTPIKTTFKGYPNYTFDDQARDFYSYRETVYEGSVDSEGYARVNFNLGSPDDAPGALRANFYGKVYEEGGDFSVNSASIPYYPYESFVGVKVPEGDKRGILLTDEDHNVNIATVDADGNPISRRNLKVSLYKVNWKWWWDKSADDLSNYVGRSYRDPVKTSRISTTNGKGTYKLRIDYPAWGRYYLQIEDPVSGHSTGQVVYLDWPGWAGKAKRGDLDGASMLDFAIEKENYEVGEKVTLSIPSTEGTRILVSLETGSEVLQTFWVQGKAETTPVSFEATADMAPNIYVHLTMVQPHGQTANDLPIRLYGVQSIPVVNPSTTLQPKISMPGELRPEQTYTLEVSEATGKAMGYTVAIVDEGLLDITNFNTPEPWSSFYRREALGIKTWDIYDDVMGAFGGQIDHLLAVGGDGALEGDDEKEANRFKPVVQFLGPFKLERGGSNRHTITLPQYIGSVKTMVVAAENGAYGSADVATPVKQPLMVLATLPRVAGPGETLKLPVNIFTLEDNIKNVAVSVETSGTLELMDQGGQTVNFQQAGDQVAYFEIKAKEVLGPGQVKVTATANGVEATYDIDLQVMPRNPISTLVDDKVLEGGADWDYAYQPLGLLGENSAVVEMSTLPPLNIEQRLNYLIKYPHGCIEQTTSSVFAQLFLDQLVDLDDKRKQKIQRNIDAAIKRLKSFQVASGGFSYWPGESYASNWGTNYAGHFLVEARDLGYAVPDAMLNSWVDYQTEKADAWGSYSAQEDNDLIQAYRLYTLAKAKKTALGAMNRMKGADDVRRSAKWRLALAYVEGGFDSQARNLVEGLSKEVDDADDYRYSFGSVERDKAMIMETLLGLGEKEEAFTLLRDIATKMGEKNRWWSTQTTAYAFIAISKYAQTFGADQSTEMEVLVDGNTQNISSESFIAQLALDDPEKRGRISLTNKGQAPVYVRIIRSGIPLEGEESAESRNLNMTVRYIDMDGRTINVDQLKQGTNFKAQVSVTNPGRKGKYDELALTQIFPSGWEIINTRLDGSAESNKLVEYLDIRDDRTMHYFDLAPNKNGTFTVLLNATYQGKYYLPSITTEAMYDNSIFASTDGKWVEVIGEN